MKPIECRSVFKKTVFLSSLFIAMISMGAVIDEEEEVASAIDVESPSSVAAAAAAVPGTQPQSKVYGMIDLRPSWSSNAGTWDTENTAQLGYQFNPDLKVDYVQYFNSSLYNRANPNAGLGLYTDVGFIRGSFDNLWVSSDNQTSFGDAVRIYTPTNPTLRTQGMVTQVRNYFKLKQKLSETVSLTLDEVPMLDVYRVNGSAAGANPIVENGLYLILEASLFHDKISVTFPIMLSSVMYHHYGGANDGRFTQMLWTWPEIDYVLSPHTSMGVSWYSGSFTKDDLSGFTIAKGLATGTLQFIVNASL